MFYPVDSLRRGGRFYLCWVADSWPLRFATITHRQLWSQDIREICIDLLEVIKNESGRPTNRFSLRLSSQLLRGLVRLYQRKVTVFVGDLCMINAHVMKSTHKKSNYEERDNVTKTSELPRFILEIRPEEEAVEETIQNNGNIVAHIEDITLKESIVPEKRMLLDDGFGELNPDQNIQLMLGERSVEMMLFKETSVQHSGLDLPLDFSTEKSHDKSRLHPREAQMEMLSEHDISVFGKSMAERTILGDFEKEIPEIPDLPHPDTPHTDKELEKDKHKGKEIEKSKRIVPDEIVLEELEEEPQVKRRKIRNKLIIDKRIKLTSDYIRSRIDNNNVETRCEVLLAPGAPRPHLGAGPPAGPLGGPARPLGAALSALRRGRLGPLERPHTRAQDSSDTQEVVLERKRHSSMRTMLEKIDEEVEGVVEKYDGNLELQDVSKQMDITYATIQEAPEPYIIQGPTDLADLPTQKLLETWQAEKRVSEKQQSPKRRRSGFVSFRHNQLSLQQPTLELTTLGIQRALMTLVLYCRSKLRNIVKGELETNKENIPQVRNPSARLTALLQRDGLADSETTGGGEEHAPGGERHPPEESNTSETPLGSLDRTKVSLGDSENTTDSKKFIREEWGTQGAMHKIYRCIKAGVAPLDVGTLVASGPVIAGHERLVAARCFTSILKLKQHGFITIYKDSKTYEIKDIKFGSKIIQDK